MIRRLSTTGYRLLDEFVADFGQLTVVIGANATGKSTLLDCLQLISHCAETPLRDVLKLHRGLPSVLSAHRAARVLHWELTIDKPAGHPFWQDLPIPGDRDFTYAVTISADAYGEPVVEQEALSSTETRPEAGGAFTWLAADPARSVIYNPRLGKLVPFDQAVLPQVPGAGAETAESRGTPVVPPGGMLGRPNALRLSQMRFYNEFPDVSYLRLLLAGLCFYSGFDVGPSSLLRNVPAEIRPDSVLAMDGANLGSVLHELLTRHAHRQSAEVLRDFLRSAYPSVDDVFAETTYGAPPKVLLRVREEGMQRVMEAWDLCDGMLRFLCLAAALLSPTPAALLAFDEPEVGLHPRLLPLVADMVKLASERTQVLVTTHSPDFLNCFDIGHVAVMSREGSKVMWGRPGGRVSLRRMLASVTGDTLGDLHRTGELEALG